MNESAADLQREAENTRAGLSHTLDELRSSLTTAAITNGAMMIAKEGSTTLARVAVERARANPLAALLIGAGIVMLLNGDKNDATGRLVRRLGKSASRAATGAASAARGTVGEALHAPRDATAGASDQARGPVEDAAGRLEGTTARVAERAHRTPGDGMDKARRLAADRQGSASHLVKENRQYPTRDGVVRLAHEQPILVAAIGVAVGAVLGAAFPANRPGSRRRLASAEGKSADICAQPDLRA